MRVLGLLLLVLISSSAFAQTKNKFELLLDEYNASSVPTDLGDFRRVQNCKVAEANLPNHLIDVATSVEEISVDNGPKFPADHYLVLHFAGGHFDEGYGFGGITYVEDQDPYMAVTVSSDYMTYRFRRGNDGYIYITKTLSFYTTPVAAGYCY